MCWDCLHFNHFRFSQIICISIFSKTTLVLSDRYKFIYTKFCLSKCLYLTCCENYITTLHCNNLIQTSYEHLVNDINVYCYFDIVRIYRQLQCSIVALLWERCVFYVAFHPFFPTDVVYDKSVLPGLIFVLKKLLSVDLGNGEKPTAYIASTIRNEDTRDQFFIMMSKSKFVI